MGFKIFFLPLTENTKTYMNKGSETYYNFLISERFFLENIRNCRFFSFPVDKTRKFFDIIAFVISTKISYRHNLIYFNSYNEGAKKLNISASVLKKRLQECEKLGFAKRIPGGKWNAKYAYEITSLKDKKKNKRHIRIIINGTKKKNIVKALFTGYSAWIFRYKDVQSRRLFKLATQKKYPIKGLSKKDISLLGKTGVSMLIRLRGNRDKFKNDRIYELYVKNESTRFYLSMSYYNIDRNYFISKSRMYRTSKSPFFQTVINTEPFYIIHNVKRVIDKNMGLIPMPRIPYSRRSPGESKRMDYMVKQELIGYALDYIEGDIIKENYKAFIGQRQQIQQTARDNHGFTTVRKVAPYTRTLPNFEECKPYEIVRYAISNSCVFIDRLPNIRTENKESVYRLVQRYKHYV